MVWWYAGVRLGWGIGVHRALSGVGSSRGWFPCETAQDQLAMAARRDYTAGYPTGTRLAVVSRDEGSRVREAQRVRAHVTLPPGQKGTKTLVAQSGHQLVCVRSRYDEAGQRRLKTVELIVEETSWRREHAARQGAVMVGVRVGVQEVSLQRKVNLAGGRLNPARRVWELRRDQALQLGLKDRLERAKVSIRRNGQVSICINLEVYTYGNKLLQIEGSLYS